VSNIIQLLGAELESNLNLKQKQFNLVLIFSKFQMFYVAHVYTVNSVKRVRFDECTGILKEENCIIMRV